MKHLFIILLITIAISGHGQSPVADSIAGVPSLDQSVPVVITDCYERHASLFFRQKVQCNYFIIVLKDDGAVDYYVDDQGRMIPARDMIRFHTFAPAPDDWVYMESASKTHIVKSAADVRAEMTPDTWNAVRKYVKQKNHP